VRLDLSQMCIDPVVRRCIPIFHKPPIPFAQDFSSSFTENCHDRVTFLKPIFSAIYLQYLYNKGAKK
jgi:hypothetical protein